MITAGENFPTKVSQLLKLSQVTGQPVLATEQFPAGGGEV